jgi:cyd operon protein YbgT
MWYFSWILGVSLACSFGILNAMWYELKADRREATSARDRFARR